MAITQILGKKIGTTQVFREDGSADCVTAIQVSPCTVTQIKSSSIDGYVRLSEISKKASKRLAFGKVQLTENPWKSCF